MIITKKQILKTALLPGIIPRFKQLFGSGFQMLAYMVALVYNTVRILPNNHPYLRADMIGHYNVRQVIAEAGNHITPNRNNIDQVIVFFSIIVALVILCVQFILFLIALLVSRAHAQDMPTTIKGFFVTPNPNEDIAYRFMDLIFGIPDFFSTNANVNTPVHQALHSLFEFYSYGMIIVGTMIIVYFIIAIVAETAQSGTPFGQRFNHAWAPIRVILFFGLLIPVTHGLNGGQYLTLTAAKLGSSLASNGWVLLNESIQNSHETLSGKKEYNVATPKAPDLTHIPAFMMVVQTCKVAYDVYYNADLGAKWDPKGADTGVRAWVVYDDGTETHVAKKISDTTFQNVTAASQAKNINIIFGIKDDTASEVSVNPICGKIVINVVDVHEPGAAVIQTAYYDLIRELWDGTSTNPSKVVMYPDIRKYAISFARRNLNISGGSSEYGTPFQKHDAQLPDDAYRNKILADLKTYMGNKESGVIKEAITAQIDNGDWAMPEKIRNYGWAGAGIWYNKIAQQNGALVSTLHQIPTSIFYPSVMEQVKIRKRQEDKDVDKDEEHNQSNAPGTTDVTFERAEESEIYTAINQVQQWWVKNPLQPDKTLTGNVIIDTINLLLGTQGLFEICENTDTHPLAQLAAVGKSMIDSAIRSIALSGVFGVVSIMPQLSTSFSAAAGFFSTIAGVGLLIGFILFYIIPFMPFLYFFFAIGGWAKSIFEAMVAMPLWALAHLRIDGDGIPGEAAIGGYHLIFEIFIRPILIVFGLLAAISIFAAMVKILNEIFYLAISNLSGHDPLENTACFKTPAGSTIGGEEFDGIPDKADLKDAYRGPVDEFFFTILYTIIVYMISSSCFKLIDMIPNTILRWMGIDTPAFNDQSGDATEGMVMYISMGGNQLSGMGNSIEGLGSGIKQNIQKFMQPK